MPSYKSRSGSRKFRKRGPRSTPPSPPRMKTSLFRTCSNKVTLTFHKHFENTRKKGGAAPSAPPLNPPMKSVVRKDRHTWDEKSQTSRTSRHFGYTQNQVYLIDWEFETNSLRMLRNLDLPRSRDSWYRPKGAPLLGTRIIPKKINKKLKEWISSTRIQVMLGLRLFSPVHVLSSLLKMTSLREQNEDFSKWSMSWWQNESQTPSPSEESLPFSVLQLCSLSSWSHRHCTECNTPLNENLFPHKHSLESQWL